MKIAIYGKGGIGKSTLAANISAALASQGARVLQIGCDPKHDSTRLLLGGRHPRTVLDYLRSTEPDQRSLDGFMEIGHGDIMCVEAGGPEPGVGCAGRGIITTFELLEELGISDLEPDVTIYDVLGDVVCGGFAVPLRREYAEMILIVTSGEFMSIYAANNILKGIRNFDGDKERVGGLIMNSKGLESEDEIVQRFASAVELPLVCSFSRSEAFLESERMGRTLVEAFPNSELALRFQDLARDILNGLDLYRAMPLDDIELERKVLGSHNQRVEAPPRRPNGPPRRGETRRYLSKNMKLREPLYGCAFAGALGCTVQIEGSVTVAHGPRNCGDIGTQSMMASGRRVLGREGRLVLNQMLPTLVVTDVTEEGMIFGGMEHLEKGLERAATMASTVFLITACPAGIIGDDIERAARRVSEAHPGLRIIPIETWGNIAGDYIQGVINACVQGAGALIDSSLEPDGDLVNLVGEKTLATNTDRNFGVTRRMLEEMGVGINCRFVARTSVERLRSLRSASLNLTASNDYFTSVLRRYLELEHDQDFIDQSLPVGPCQTEEWLRAIGSHFGSEDRSDVLIHRLRAEYERGASMIRPHLEGRRIMIFTWNHDVDWIIELALDMGMEVSKVCILSKLDYGRDVGAVTRYADLVEFEEGYQADSRYGDIEAVRPDLVLANYVPAGMPASAHYDTLPFCPDIGFLSGLEVAERWRRMLLLPKREGWRKDVPDGS